MSSAFKDLCALRHEVATFNSVGSLLGWDQETYMPPAAADHRATQLSLLAGLVHEKRTSRRMGELLAACEQGGLNGATSAGALADLREMRRDYELATRLPTSLVAELAKTTSQAQEVWKEARAKSDFALFAPMLDKVLDLTRRKAECLGRGENYAELYDALLDEYEPGMTAARVEATFNPLRTRLSALVADIGRSARKPDGTLLKRRLPVPQQQAFGERVLKAMGFDSSAGRLDQTAHPFCSGMAPGDTRLTTRYTSESFLEPLYGTMHEGGHGLYEQGLPKGESFGLPVAEATSLGIHESQSRLWENFVGRSRAFWTWALPIARQTFAPALDDLSLDQAFGAANLVEPSFIRVEADEATYNLHIMLRFSVERALVNGDLAVRDLPGEWNRQFKGLLGLSVPDDRRGCLQDVHWSFGLFGYFPTYTLGNLYAGQFWEAVNRAIPDLEAQMARGEFGALLAWLRTNIHAHGRRYRAEELCQRVTGQPLKADGLLRYLEGKLRPLYRV